jgi:hypothetical protein
MAKNYVDLYLEAPDIRIELTEELQKVWNEIQFHEDSGQYTLYDAAWDKFLKLAHNDIMDQFANEIYVSGAKERRGQ